jgi:6-phosphogluconolactonase
VEIVVRRDVGAVAREAAERVLAAAAAAVSSRGRFTVALAGGSTPASLYGLFASAKYIDRLDWKRAEVFFGDERCVPPEHEWSNYAMARRTLLEHVPVPQVNVHRISGELGPHDAAVEYAATIQSTFSPLEGATPRFDLILLGMGDDGHTASLFPGMPALLERDAWTVGTSVPEYVRPPVSRVTFTLPLLNAARQVIFLVTGQAKAEPAQRVLVAARRDSAAAALPAAQVQPYDGQLVWLMDEPAASLIRR